MTLPCGPTETPGKTFGRGLFSHKTVQADGDEISARRVMAALKELIRNEDKHAPLSDERLTQLLVQQGFHIARRTVAKYREQMGLPVARMRR